MRGTSIPIILVLFSIAHGNPCPPGYTKGPNDVDCYQIKTFYDTFATRYFSKSFDEAETECNKDGGGMLASIHSQEEIDFISSLPCMELFQDFGLWCIGRVCKWDDGSPLTFTNFEGEGPIDDGKTRCYEFDGTYPSGTWKEQSCGEQEHDCWICRVKARTIECNEGETEYKGGCVSVHTTPLDQRSAEASCPGGGHLVSIHSIGDYSENFVFTNAALNAGVNGTIYIGGKFSNGQFDWIDGSHNNANNWATGFPNAIFGSCVQMLLASEFGSQGQWTNIDCSTKQAYMCFRDGAEYGPVVPIPKASAACPPLQQYNVEGTTLYSPNYPFSIPSEKSCSYLIDTMYDHIRASVKFNSYDCQAGITLSLFNGVYTSRPFATFYSSPPPLNQWYNATSRYLRMVFTTTNDTAPIGTGWQAEWARI